MDSNYNVTSTIRETTISGVILVNDTYVNGENDSWFNRELADQYKYNRRVDSPAYEILIAMYCLLIVVGVAGNLLVVISVVRKPAMRTARNIFIVNLAVSDLLFCAVTMPLTLVEILAKYWPFKQPFICKLISTLQATSIFVSTISITAIALDRYQVIMYPTKDSLQLMGAGMILSLIWLIALILASPMYIYHRLHYHPIKIAQLGIDGISFCTEDWPMEYGGVYYSIFTLVFQYILPFIVVSVAYKRISYKLRYRYATGYVGNENASGSRQALRGRRLQRTNLLLASIAIIYGISWLPLNLFNLLSDLRVLLEKFTQPEIIAYAVCHMIGMSSACSNPLLYGWLNDNFRKEFYDILCWESCERRVSNNATMQRLSTARRSERAGGGSSKKRAGVATTTITNNTITGAGTGTANATTTIVNDTEMTVISK